MIRSETIITVVFENSEFSTSTLLSTFISLGEVFVERLIFVQNFKILRPSNSLMTKIV